MAQMKQLHPLVETYLQNLKEDKALDAPVPISDVYFLGRLDMSEGTDDRTFSQPSTAGLGKRMFRKLGDQFTVNFLPLGFAQMVVLDQDFQRKYYDFAFVRREFLGEIRCIVVDIAPKKDAGKGRFVGRAWIEDQDYNIVRFNGTYSSHQRNGYYLHFDSWRQNLRPGGIWLSSMIYSEESDLKSRLGQTLHYKAQTRLWGYNLKDLRRNSEFTEITVDAPQSVQDQSQKAQDASPIEAQRQWERQAEINVLDRLQQIGRQFGRPLTMEQARAFGFDRQVLQQTIAEAALDEDPAGPKAQALAGRWAALITEFTGGDPAIAGKVRAIWGEAMADPQAAPTLPLTPEVFAFMGQAMAILKETGE